MIKDAVIKVELRCGPNGRIELLDTCRSFAGIGGGYEPCACDKFKVAVASYKAFGDVANQISLLEKNPPVVIKVTAYYENMLGLHIRMRRAYRVGEAEKGDANVVKMWSDKLAPGPHLSGNVNEDFYTCYNHFRVSMTSDTVLFSLEEMTEEASFEAVSDNRYLQEIVALRVRMKA